MRGFVYRISRLLVRSQAGRWMLTVALLLIGTLVFIAGMAPSQGQTQTQTVSYLIAGALVFILGIVMLVVTVRMGGMRKQVIAARTTGVARGGNDEERANTAASGATARQKRYRAGDAGACRGVRAAHGGAALGR